MDFLAGMAAGILAIVGLGAIGVVLYVLRGKDWF